MCALSCKCSPNESGVFESARPVSASATFEDEGTDLNRIVSDVDQTQVSLVDPSSSLILFALQSVATSSNVLNANIHCCLMGGGRVEAIARVPDQRVSEPTLGA